MLTRKHLDYVDWKKLIEIKNAGLYKTVEGLALINRLTNQMNSKRVESKAGAARRVIIVKIKQ